MTKYKDIASDIRDKIIAGDWFYGMKIPSQRQLAIQYNVNRVTIIKSIELLERLKDLSILKWGVEHMLMTI